MWPRRLTRQRQLLCVCDHSTLGTRQTRVPGTVVADPAKWCIETSAKYLVLTLGGISGPEPSRCLCPNSHGCTFGWTDGT